MDKKLLLIINPKSGTKQAPKHLAELVGIFSKGGYLCTVCLTDRRGAATDFVLLYGAQHDLIVCVGGDGTLNEVINGILRGGIGVPIGYIPAGSTNDFANGLHLSSNIITAAHDIIDGRRQKLDIGRFGDQYFSYVASFGAFTRVSYSTPQDMKNALGHLAYLLEGAKDIPAIRSEHLCFETAQGTFEDDYIFGAISNSTSLGGVLTISPDVVDMNDGLFEILLIKAPKNLDELLRITAALSKKQYDIDLIDFASTQRVCVTTDGSIDWSLDGEHAATHGSVVIENIRDAVTIIVNDSDR